MSSVNVSEIKPLSNVNELKQIEKNIETGKAKKTIPLVAEDKIKAMGDDVKISNAEKEIKPEEKGFFQIVGESFKQWGNDIANAKTFKDKVGVVVMGKPLYEADISNAQKALALCSPSYASSLLRAQSAPSVITTATKGQTAPSDYKMSETAVEGDCSQSAIFYAAMGGLGSVIKTTGTEAAMENSNKNNKIED